MNTNVRSWAVSAALLLALAGCSEEKKEAQPIDADAGVNEPGRKQAALGGKLAAAVKAAESAQASPSAKAEDGPPEKGVFAPGAADKVHAIGAAPKIEVLGEGADPKITLAYAPSEAEQKVNVSVAFRMNGRGVPLDYVLSVKPEKSKDKKDPAAGTRVVATVSGLNLSPQLPKDAVDQLSKLKGSEIKYTLSPAGAMSDAAVALAKGADPTLDQLMQAIVEGLTLLTPPLPSKPVGVGAYWMVTDRVPSGIVDVVRYRVFRVEKIEKDRATLSADVRQYAAKNEVDAGGGQKLAVLGFDSRGKLKVEFAASSLLPPAAEGQVGMALDGRVAGGQQGGAQTELTVKIQGVEKK